ncbi:MAG TPA: SDR family oxidoreductase [Solirubrobacteraceae bacterium]|nr:SDR family oxidoreductase [Solirubrobacteraceae bacterium]
MPTLDNTHAIVVGASRGLGRGVAQSLSAAGASVLAIARGQAGLDDLRASDPAISVLAGDGADPELAARAFAAHAPDVLAVVAGASPESRPIQDHTWESFSRNWEVDVRLTFTWLQAALRRPLRPGSRVLLMSSGAAVAGSPLSGGYAGAKATIRFMAGYGDEEARRAGLGIRVLAVLPRLTPATELGLAAVRAYAQRAGITQAQYVANLGGPVTPELAGAAFVELASGTLSDDVAYLLTGDRGLAPVPSLRPAAPPARAVA